MNTWHLSTAYNAPLWTVYCGSDWQPGDLRTFFIAEVTCDSCRERAREVGVKGA